MVSANTQRANPVVIHRDSYQMASENGVSSADADDKS
jgi:hypothetical protein